MSELYTFADFELDGARFELRRAGRAVVLQPKALRMLLHLVKERERAVSIEELFEVLWPRERVGMGSIRRAVLGVRRALGEAGESQLSVRTVRGFGYQFVRPLRLAAAQRALPARSWDADRTARGAADTLPLYGDGAPRVRQEVQMAWQRGDWTAC